MAITAWEVRGTNMEYPEQKVVNALKNVIDECVFSLEKIADANGVNGREFIRIVCVAEDCIALMENRIKEKRNGKH